MKERRKEVGKLVYVARFLAVLAWLIFCIALVVSFYAAPDENFGLLRHHKILARDFWLTPLTGGLFILLWLCALFSYIAITINHYRDRRANDHKLFNAILLFIVCCAWLIYIIGNF